MKKRICLCLAVLFFLTECLSFSGPFISNVRASSVTEEAVSGSEQKEDTKEETDTDKKEEASDSEETDQTDKDSGSQTGDAETGESEKEDASDTQKDSSEEEKQTETDTDADADTGNLAKGSYSLPVKLLNAGADTASMGNAALTQTAALSSDGKGNLSLILTFHAMEYLGTKGYIYSLCRMKNVKLNSYNYPESYDLEASTILERFDKIYDDFNKKSSSLYDKKTKGEFYPKKIAISVEKEETLFYVQVYVPVMESIGSGQGTKDARLSLDWSKLKKTSDEEISVSSKSSSSTASSSSKTTTSKTSTSTASSSKTTTSSSKTSSSKSSSSKTLDRYNLEDGVYILTGHMVKGDKSSASMSDNAINHNIKLTVKNGKYTLTMSFQGLAIGTKTGYLSNLKYFVSGYSQDAYGNPKGSKKNVTVKSYQTDSAGKRISDSYGSNYPKTISFPMIKEALSDGYVPLQVFVPVMESLSAGNGTQTCYLSLDYSTLAATTNSNSKFKTSSGVSSSGSSSTASSSSGDESASASSALTSGSSLTSGSLLSGGSLAETGSEERQDTTVSDADQTGQAAAQEASSALGGSEAAASYTKEAKLEPPLRKYVLPGFLVILAGLVGVFVNYARKRKMWIFRKNKIALHLLFLCALTGFLCAQTSLPASAASGTVYSCKVNPCYEHPVTGEIEDAGGESAKATGLGMVESCLSSQGMLEAAEDGKYYLTVRMCLMDYTSGHTFWVQKKGDSAWSDPKLSVTGSGSDSNGTTKDVCMEIPEKDAIVRCSMYVEPMGRDVIFYFYASDFTEGKPEGFTAAMVTGDNGADTDEEAAGATSALAESASEADESAAAESSRAAESETADSSQAAESETAASESSQVTEDTEKGLSLSTEEEASESVSADTSQSAAFTVGQQIFINIVSYTVSGLLLMCAAAGLVFLFLKKRYSWFAPPAGDLDLTEIEEEDE